MKLDLSLAAARVLSIAALLAAPSLAQITYHYPDICSPLYQFDGGSQEPFFGTGVHNLGDVDQDGVDDLLVSIGPSTVGLAAVRSFSLATGSEIYTVQAVQALAAGGDANADGTPDWVAMAPGQIQLRSGLDGALLWSRGLTSQLTFGTSASMVGDVDGDGLGDVLIGSPREAAPRSAAGVARLLSGLDGTLLRTHTGQRADQNLGAGVVGLGDRDGDGRADYAIGSPGAGAEQRGQVEIYSGATGQLVQTLRPTSETPGSFGEDLDLADDLDGDGMRDLTVLDNVARFGRPGRLYAYSNATGALIYAVDGEPSSRRLLQIAANVADLDGDGIGDLVAAVRRSGTAPREAVELLSGADGSLIRSYIGPTNYEDPFYVTGVSGLNTSAGSAFVVASPRLAFALVVDSANPVSIQLCDGGINTRGLRASLSFLGPRSVAENQLRIRVQQASALRQVQIFYGGRRTQIPFGQGTLCIGGPLHRIGGLTQLGPGGGATILLDLTDPTLTSGPAALTPGSTWAFQAWYRDTPPTFNFTSAASLTLCP